MPITDFSNKLILVGAYRSDKKQLDWILGKQPLRSNKLYNVRTNEDLFSQRDGGVNTSVCPDYVLLYNCADITQGGHMYKCLSIEAKSESEMKRLHYPAPKGSYIVCTLGHEIAISDIDISNMLTTLKEVHHVTVDFAPIYAMGEEIEPFIKLSERVSNEEQETQPTYIDLFSGSGGFSLGFDWAGFQNVFSVEYDSEICETYRYNFPSHNLVECDITKLKDEEVVKLVDGRKIDVIIGGPPCQGFSMAGNIGRKFADDPRNMLFKEFVRIVRIVQPTCFVMENVARLYTRLNGETRNEIIDCFEALGYVVEAKVVCASDYGVPQNRSRVLFIGRKTTDKLYPIQFPQKSSKPCPTVKDAIDKYPPLESGQTSNIPNHEAMEHSVQMLEKMSYVKDGGGREDIPEHIRPEKGDIREYIRYDSSKPSICITGDMRKVFHYSQNRALTVRELAAIQSYPDSFIFLGNKIKQQQMVGNSVPPLLAKAIAEGVKEMI
jgi:DNA (cytosine-5)-methyltransferase 1